MTHQDFNRLYDQGLLDIKFYSGMVNGDKWSVEAFTWDGRYYLRIHKVHHYTLKRRNKNYAMANEMHIIKEFTTGTQANNYFKKLADGQLKRG